MQVSKKDISETCDKIYRESKIGNLNVVGVSIQLNPFKLKIFSSENTYIFNTIKDGKINRILTADNWIRFGTAHKQYNCVNMRMKSCVKSYISGVKVTPAIFWELEKSAVYIRCKRKWYIPFKGRLFGGNTKNDAIFDVVNNITKDYPKVSKMVILRHAIICVINGVVTITKL